MNTNVTSGLKLHARKEQLPSSESLRRATGFGAAVVQRKVISSAKSSPLAGTINFLRIGCVAELPTASEKRCSTSHPTSASRLLVDSIDPDQPGLNFVTCSMGRMFHNLQAPRAGLRSS